MKEVFKPVDKPLRVLVVHNGYQQRGGEDSVVASEVALLREHGHEVVLHERHNDEVAGMPRARLLADTMWSRQTVQAIEHQAATRRPDIIHVHNTMPLVSPSVFWAAHRLGIPVVQTIHNFRLMCLNGAFMREGDVCEDCLGTLPWRGVLRRCYRESTLQSAALGTMLVLHRGLGTFRHKVTRYIALNEFCKAKLIEGGLPPERISIKPNSVEWRSMPDEAGRQGGLFVGRLTTDKGVEVILEAEAATPGGLQALQVVGGGPLEREVAAQLGPRYLGLQPLDEVMARMSKAAYLLLPSVNYEGFPRTVVEAYCCGLPVIASRLGSMAEVIEDGVTGLLFNPADAADMAAKMAWAAAHPQAMAAMGRTARQRYETRFSPEVNHGQLLGIYAQAIAESAAVSGYPMGRGQEL